jgi:hypothetical protein
MNTREEHTITRNGTEYTWIVCHKCAGSKVFSCWQHIFEGKCFTCEGKGGWYKSAAELAKKAKRQAAAAKRAAKKAEAARAKTLAKLEATIAAKPELKRALELAAGIECTVDYDRDREILTHADLGGRTDRELRQLEDLARKLTQKGTLTDKQAAFMLKLATPATCTRCGELGHTDRDCSQRATVEAGRQVITGKLVSEREEAPFVAWGSSTTKCLIVCDDGRKFWGTKPRCSKRVPAWYDETQMIDEYTPINLQATISFKATVERSSDDPHFGTFKRPGKATILEQGPEPEAD